VRECHLSTGYGAGMEISVRQGQEASDVLVLLTEREADEVARAFRSRLDGEAGHRGPGYHLHSRMARCSELTIGVLDPE
jgi:hypothetical protein